MSARNIALTLFDEKLFTGCNLVLFEDDRTSEELFPLAVLRPSWEIRSGAGCSRYWLTQLRQLDNSILYRPRARLCAISAQMAGSVEDEFDPELDTVFLNGRVFGFWKSQPGISTPLPDSITDEAGRLLYCRLRGSQVAKILMVNDGDIGSRVTREIGTSHGIPEGWTISYARYVWEYMSANPDILTRQLTSPESESGDLMGARALRETPAGIGITDPLRGHRIYIGSNVKLMPGVVFGNNNGPIWIGDNTEIEPHTYLEGPLFIGPNFRVKAGAKIYHGTSMGPHCRVAGEITGSILQGYVNKQHEGFLGNSHLGEWVNLGADTTNSNLRNDYGEIKIQVGRRLVKSGQQFIGLLCGDHTKTGINTMFNTGTVVGVGANVYGAGFPPRFIGSFMWGGASGLEPTQLERTLTSARFAMSRRGRELTESEEQLLRLHFGETVKEENLS